MAQRNIIAAALYACLTCTLAGAAQAGSALSPLLGSEEVGLADLSALPQWRAVLARMQSEKPQIEACEADVDACATPTIVAWRAKIAVLAYESPYMRLVEVNRFVNALPRGEDATVFATADYWASPLEFLHRTGDDEDAAILKYAMLRELGIAEEEIRIVLARDLLRNADTVLVVACVDDISYVLSNEWGAPLDVEQAAIYVPSLSFNEDARWLHLPPKTSDVAIAVSQQGQQ